MNELENRFHREKRSVAEEFGDIRQAFDLWLNRASLPEDAEWVIRDLMDALEGLAEYIPSEAA
jgi:hypothetical protein